MLVEVAEVTLVLEQQVQVEQVAVDVVEFLVQQAVLLVMGTLAAAEVEEDTLLVLVAQAVQA
jgi:hypothetical protein